MPSIPASCSTPVARLISNSGRQIREAYQCIEELTACHHPAQGAHTAQAFFTRRPYISGFGQRARTWCSGDAPPRPLTAGQLAAASWIRFRLPSILRLAEIATLGRLRVEDSSFTSLRCANQPFAPDPDLYGRHRSGSGMMGAAVTGSGRTPLSPDASEAQRHRLRRRA